MTQQNPQVHCTTPAEAVLLAAIDSVVDNLAVDDVLPMIDFLFLRDYTVMRIHARLFSFHRRDCTRGACACVGLSRYYYRDNHLATLKIAKK